MRGLLFSAKPAQRSASAIGTRVTRRVTVCVRSTRHRDCHFELALSSKWQNPSRGKNNEGDGGKLRVLLFYKHSSGKL